MNNWHELLAVAIAVVKEGLRYTDNNYDRERYLRLSETVERLLRSPVEESPPGLDPADLLAADVATPKVGADVALFDRDGRLLVLQRSDDRTWGLPGGWVNVGEHPGHAALRELREETAIAVESLNLIDIIRKGPPECPTFVDQINVLYGVRLPDIPSVTLSNEHCDYRCISEPDETIQWHCGHDAGILRAFEWMGK